MRSARCPPWRQECWPHTNRIKNALALGAVFQLSKDAFEARYLAARQPVVITGLATNWPAAGWLQLGSTSRQPAEGGAPPEPQPEEAQWLAAELQRSRALVRSRPHGGAHPAAAIPTAAS